MNSKLCKFLLLSFLTIFSLVGFTACGDEITEVIEEHYSGAQMERYTFDVKKDMWKWNDEVGRYECFFDFPKLDTKIYELGGINVTVFVNPKTNDEVQHPMPYPHTYRIPRSDGTFYTYTQHISYDAVPENIGFFIQSSDLDQAEYDLVDCQFKVILFWDTRDYD